MQTLKEIQESIIEEFAIFSDWTEKYEYIIDLGKSLPLIEPQHKTDENIVKGCQSNVWLHADFQDGKMIYKADGDAIITKGIIALLLRVYSNQSPKEIVNSDLSFIDSIGLKEHLSPTRANGLVAIVKRIRIEAIARTK